MDDWEHADYCARDEEKLKAVEKKDKSVEKD